MCLTKECYKFKTVYDILMEVWNDESETSARVVYKNRKGIFSPVWELSRPSA